MLRIKKLCARCKKKMDLNYNYSIQLCSSCRKAALKKITTNLLKEQKQ